VIARSGIFHILATPFREDGSLDVEGLPRLVESALATGVTGLTILGIAGEAHRLTDEERRRVVEIVVKETRGRTPVAVGVSASGTHLATAFARMAREHGADALMVAPPTGLKNLDAVAEYYRTVATATRLPLVLQDEPVTTQVMMPAPFIAQMCAEIPALRGRPPRRGPRALLPLAAPDPLREPAGRHSRHRGRYPEGDPAASGVDHLRDGSTARPRARRGHARRDRRAPGR
jgi:dihydrodipicolinate synthetase family protein